MVCDDSRHLACIRVSRQAGFDGVRPAKQLSSVSKPEAPFNVSAMTADMNTHTHSLSLSLSLSLSFSVCVFVCVHCSVASRVWQCGALLLFITCFTSTAYSTVYF